MKLITVFKALFFCLLLTSLLCIIGWRMDVNTRSQYDMRYADVVSGKFSNVDFAVFGASQLVHGINPKYLEKKGFSSYNFAFNGASPEFTYKWYNKIYLEHNPPPKIVLIDVSKSSFDTSYVWRQIEQDSKYFSVKSFISEMISVSNSYKEKKTIFLNRFDIFREKKHPECLFVKKEQVDFDNDRFYKGYVPYLLNVDCDQYFSPKNNEKSKQYFVQLIEELKRQGSEVVFVASPVYLGEGFNTELKTFDYVEKIAAKYAVRYLNYNDTLQSEINADKSNYADCLHLNDKGSQLFSKNLADDLLSMKMAAPK